MSYYNKYLKYKNKYLTLKRQLGGSMNRMGSQSNNLGMGLSGMGPRVSSDRSSTYRIEETYNDKINKLKNYYYNGDIEKNNIDKNKILKSINNEQYENANIEQLQIHILKNNNKSYSKWLEQYNTIHMLIKEIAELHVSKHIKNYNNNVEPNPVIQVHEFFYILESYYQKILNLYKENNNIFLKDTHKIEKMWLLFNPNLKIKVTNNTYINLIENNFSTYIKCFKINTNNIKFINLTLIYDLNCTYNYVICRENNKFNVSNLKLKWPVIKLNNKIIFEDKVIDDKDIINYIKKIQKSFIECEKIVEKSREERKKSREEREKSREEREKSREEREINTIS